MEPIRNKMLWLLFVLVFQREAHTHAKSSISNPVETIGNELQPNQPLNVDEYTRPNDSITPANNSKEYIEEPMAVVDDGKLKVNDCLGLGGPFSGVLENWLKSSSRSDEPQIVDFYMSSREMPRPVTVNAGQQFGLEWTDFQIHRNTVVIVHGFLSGGKEPWVQQMANAFLRLGDYNVIAVDWSKGSETFNYYKAVVNTQLTGNQLTMLLEQIYNATGAGKGSGSVGSIHCVGHSLGAHICGYAAYQLKRRESLWTMGRITGLDPAQPCFTTAELSLRLDKHDADFVDVIHTNGRLTSRLGFGLPAPIGHADFFPNGGKMQPGCARVSSHPSIPLPPDAINKAICSHGRSYLYFTESINAAISNNCTFWAHPWNRTYRNIMQILTINCKTNMCSEMGINSDKHKNRGTYFVLTSASEPYCYNGNGDTREAMSMLDQDDFKGSLED